MKLKVETVDCFTLSDIQGLDPVTAYFSDQSPGQGRLTVVCYGTAWTAWWGSMGSGATVREFVRSLDAGYLYGCLVRSNYSHGKQTKQQEEYLRRVIAALFQTLKETPHAHP